MTKLALMIVCLVASYAPGVAQTTDSAAYQALLDKTVELQVKYANPTGTLEASFANLVKKGTLTEAQCHAMSAEIAALMEPRLAAMSKKLLSDAFSYAELKQVYDWLASPIGQKLQGMSTKTAEMTQALLSDPEFMQQLTSIVARYVN